MEYAHINNGKIFVRVGEAIGFDDLHNMNQTNAETAGQVMTWQAGGFGQFAALPNTPLGFQNATPGNVTGTTTLTIVQSILIPANTFAPGDTLDLSVRFTKTTTVATVSVRTAINTALTNVGSTQIFTSSFASTQLFTQLQRTLHIISATNTTTLGTGIGGTTDYTGSTTSPTSINLNWMVDQYLFTTITLTNVNDIATSAFLRLTRYRS